MTRYFFDIHDGIGVRDETGVELPGVDAARAHAIERASRYVAQLDGGGQGGYIVVTIRDAAATLLTLRLVCRIDRSGMTASDYLRAVRRKEP